MSEPAFLDDFRALRKAHRATEGVATGGGPPHDPGMEVRVKRLEDDMKDIRGILGRMEPMIIRIDEQLKATLPILATKADLVTATAPMGGIDTRLGTLERLVASKLLSWWQIPAAIAVTTTMLIGLGAAAYKALQFAGLLPPTP